VKAFKIRWIGEPTKDSYYAAPTAAKAKAHAVSLLEETGYAQDYRHALSQLIYCRRVPDLDAWASQFKVSTSRSQEYVCCSIVLQ